MNAASSAFAGCSSQTPVFASPLDRGRLFNELSCESLFATEYTEKNGLFSKDFADFMAVQEAG